MSKTIFTKFTFPLGMSLFPRGLHIKFGLDWPSGFEKSCLKIIIIHMYIAPRQGQTTPVVKVCVCFFNINLLFIWLFVVFPI